MRALAALLYLVAALLAVPALVTLADGVWWVITDRTVTGLDYHRSQRIPLAAALAMLGMLAAAAANLVRAKAGRAACRHQWSDSHYIYRVGWFRRCERCGHAEMTKQPDRPSHWSARLAPSYERPPAPPAPPPVKEV